MNWIIDRGSDVPSEQQLTRWREATPLLDDGHPAIQALIQQRDWKLLPEHERIGAVYDFVRNEIAFGYNASDDIGASQVLADRIGQCNTKGTLLMALLRAVGVACRLHGFTIDKALQKGAITGLAYWLAPQNIVHSWVEVWYQGHWINLEGFILDRTYLDAVQRSVADRQGAFCGFGVATPDVQRPPVEWQGKDTYIQKDGINRDYGVFDSPDDFYAQHGANLSGLKRWLFQDVFRKQMNQNVGRIRSKGLKTSSVSRG